MTRLIIPQNAHWLYKSSHSKKLLPDKEKMIKRVLPFSDTFKSLDLFLKHFTFTIGLYERVKKSDVSCL